MKKAGFTLSTIIYMLCCLYGSMFYACNSIDAVYALVKDTPYKWYFRLDDGTVGLFIDVGLICAFAMILITVLTKSDPWALGMWSMGILFVSIFIFPETYFPVIAFLFLAEIAYAGFVLIKNIKSLE